MIIFAEPYMDFNKRMPAQCHKYPNEPNTYTALH